MYIFRIRRFYKGYSETRMKGFTVTKKDIAIIAGPLVGALAFAAVNIAAVKIKERRAKKADQKDVITELMEEAQKN